MSEFVPADNAECSFCGTPYLAHKAQEQSGQMFHMWARHGDPVREVVKERPAAEQQQVVIAPAPDILLRRLLRDTGVISQEQYDGLFGP